MKLTKSYLPIVSLLLTGLLQSLNVSAAGVNVGAGVNTGNGVNAGANASVTTDMPNSNGTTTTSQPARDYNNSPVDSMKNKQPAQQVDPRRDLNQPGSTGNNNNINNVTPRNTHCYTVDGQPVSADCPPNPTVR